MRPISPIVDVTNYVLIELGHPTHAFDLAKLAGSEIRVRRAKAARPITTLDGVDRTLDPDMLVIADRDRAQAVAGVMGGAARKCRRRTTTRGVRERVLQAGVGPAHEQAARPQDRSLVALRARRRHQRAGRRAPAACRAAWTRSAPAASSPRSSTCTRARATPAAPHAAGAAELRCSASPCPTGRRADPERSGSGRDADRRRLGRRSRRRSASICCAKSTSSRKSAAITASTSSPATFPGRDRAGAAARSAHPARSARAPGADGRRSVRSGHVRIHRSQGRRRVRHGRRRRPSRSRTRCRPSSTRCGRRCCRASSTPSRTTAGTDATTCGCSRSARASATDGETRAVGVAWTGSTTPVHWSGRGARRRLLRRQGCRRAALRCAWRRRAVRSRRASRFWSPGQTAAIVSADGRRGRRRSASSVSARRRSPTRADCRGRIASSSPN